MAGTKSGGENAAETNKKRYGEDFYKRIGRRGGALSKTGGFASKAVGRDGLTGSQRASIAGRKGGLKTKKDAWTTFKSRIYTKRNG